MRMFKRFLIAAGVLLSLLFAACSANTPTGPGGGIDDYTHNLVRSVSGLDTITPPINPLHPVGPAVADLDCFHGYLDCARYVDNKRYCALIGLTRSVQNVYFLKDSTNAFFRYDSPLVAGLSVGQVLYVRGVLEEQKHDDRIALILHVADIEPTDSIVLREYYWHP